MNKKLTTISCPVCSGEMEIRELECSSCNIQVRGHFGKGNRFEQLTSDQVAFLETFIKCRGVLRDVEATLGISYPTVRARLDALLAALDFSDTTSVETPKSDELIKPKGLQRKEILAALDAGTLDAASALEALNNLK